MLKSIQDNHHFIAQQIGITIKDLEITLSLISSVHSTEPELLEVVKVWKMKQTLPDVFDWCEILLYTPIVDINEEHYLLFEITDWGVNSRDSFDFLEGRTYSTEIDVESVHYTAELLFENDAHDCFD